MFWRVEKKIIHYYIFIHLPPSLKGSRYTPVIPNIKDFSIMKCVTLKYRKQLFQNELSLLFMGSNGSEIHTPGSSLNTR